MSEWEAYPDELIVHIGYLKAFSTASIVLG